MSRGLFCNIGTQYGILVPSIIKVVADLPGAVGVKTSMEELSNSLNFLSWPTQVVNELRAMLAEFNVPLPAVLAQLLAIAVLMVVGWYLFGSAKSGERSIIRAASRAVLVGMVVGTLSIIVAWVDNTIAPRSHEIVGRLASSNATDLQVDLLDYKSESLGPRVEVDSSGAFVVSYTPVFADPPKALRIRVADCEERDQPLTRAHLLGSEMTVQMKCDDNG